MAHYIKVLSAEKSRLERLALRGGLYSENPSERRALGRREVMREVKDRVEWERWEGERTKKAEAEVEAARVAFAEIDWQDFVVVSTVEFTEADDLIDLPPPMTLTQVQNMSIKDKRRAAERMEGKEIDGLSDADADEIVRDVNGTAPTGETEMEVDSGDDDEVARKQAIEIKTADTSGTMKIRKDYVPKCTSSPPYLLTRAAA